MIVESVIERAVGDECDLYEHEFGDSQVVRARVVRVATEEEYVESCLADPLLPEASRPLTVVTGEEGRWWYEVEVVTDAKCRCGSRLPARDLLDARGIYVSRVCDSCEAAVKARYRPDVFTDLNYWTDEAVEEDE